MIERVIEQRRKSLGGFEVGRVLPFAQLRMVGPFIFFDHFGPMQLPKGVSRDVDVRPHPHIGLATISYLFAGEMMHRDSIGSEQAVRPGEVNWMTAGRGITHSERFEKARREGGSMHGIQTWVALPDGKEEIEPAFEHYEQSELFFHEEQGVRTCLIAGRAFGETSRVATYSPMFYVHWQLAAGAKAKLPDEYPERAAYVVSGTVAVGGTTFEAGRMLVFAAETSVVLTVIDDATVLLIGGEPVGERFIEWNFVSSSKERIEQAKADWRAGRMKLPDFDHDEFIPLPADANAPANPMS